MRPDSQARHIGIQHKVLVDGHSLVEDLARWNITHIRSPLGGLGGHQAHQGAILVHHDHVWKILSHTDILAEN